MAHKSLVKTIIRGSTGLVVGAFLVAMVIECWHVYTISEKAHITRLEQELTLLSQSLENLLWALDDHAVELVGDAYMAGTDSVSLKVLSSHTTTPVYFRQKEARSRTTYGQQDIYHDGAVIGSIEIGLSGESYSRDLLHLMTYSVILAVFIVVSLSLLVRLMIIRQLANPLALLGEWTDRVASGEFDAEPPPIDLVELDSLATKFSNMSDKIQGREQELVAYRDQLQELVDLQTLKLKEAQAELLQRERLATLGKLTATVSHELRNPLGTIKTSLFAIEAMLADHEVHRVRRSMELADRSINRCVTIVEELNSYARVKKLNVSRVEVDAWLNGVIAELDIPEDIVIEMKLDFGGSAVFDQEKLRQVIVNLVNNSVDALRDERAIGKTMSVSTRRIGDAFEICIADQGCGITEEVQDKMFEPLFSTKGFGVGLGMVVVKSIVESHQGHVLVDSAEGRGCRITLHLPVEPATGQ